MEGLGLRNIGILSGQFNPRFVPNVLLWLDAADSSTLTLSGSNVTEWRDKSGNNLTFTTPGTQPTYNSTDKAVVFNGTSSYMELGASAVMVSQTQTTFMVVKPTGTITTAAQALFRHGYNTSITLTGFFQQYSGPAEEHRVYFYSRNTANNMRSSFLAAGPGVYEIDQLTLLRGEWRAADEVQFFANSTAAGVTTSADNNPSTHVRTRLGSSSLTSPGTYWPGEIYEVIMFTRTLTATEISQVNNYLNKKWNIT
jgi:hypothetical protein